VVGLDSIPAWLETVVIAPRFRYPVLTPSLFRFPSRTLFPTLTLGRILIRTRGPIQTRKNGDDDREWRRKMKRPYSKFVNLFPNNPTQNRYRRALKTVTGDMETDFSKRQEAFKKKWRNLYEEGLDD
jgi:hypothetical protein